MLEWSNCEFVLAPVEEEPARGNEQAMLTGWETVIFELEDVGGEGTADAAGSS